MTNVDGAQEKAEAKTLIVVVGGMWGRMKHWKLLQAALQESGVKGTWYYYRWAPSLSRTIGKLIEGLVTEIDNIENSYNEIILVGHSAGGMIVRDAYLLAAGGRLETSPTPDNVRTYTRADGRNWSTKVSSILLFASINRGFRPYADAWWAIGVAFGKLISFEWIFSRPLRWFPFGWLLDLERGSFFITNVRLAWMKHFRPANKESLPIVVQFLGDVDGVVAREDIRDTDAFINSYTVEIPGAGHDNLFDLREAPAKAAYPQILNAFRDPKDVPAERLAPLSPTGPSLVVFVLHGIRDSNAGWVTDVAEEIEKQAKLPVLVDRSTYGWFSAIKFALPWVRKRNIPWFLDRYSYHFARNPNAQFHFIGHSNGTYILGTSMLEVPAMTFESVYLAGSVLPVRFPWGSMLGQQVRSVANQCSVHDWPVGVLCRSLQALGFADVGTGGYDGFSTLPGGVQTLWFDGDHGAPLGRPNQQNIVNYILHAAPLRAPVPLATRRNVGRQFLFLEKHLPTLLPVFLGLIIIAAWLGWNYGHPALVLLVAVLVYAVLDIL